MKKDKQRSVKHYIENSRSSNTNTNEKLYFKTLHYYCVYPAEKLQIIKLYNYLLIVPIDIFCQKELNWIYSYFPKAQQITCDRGNRKAIYSKYL